MVLRALGLNILLLIRELQGMGYLIGGVLLLAVLFLFFKRDINRFNQQCLIDFPAWLALYTASQMPDKGGMARAFLIQSIHMAEGFGALSAAASRELSVGLRRENPVSVVNEWLESALPNVVDVVGSASLSDVPARQVGALMIVALMGVNPQRDLRDFMQRFGR